MTVIQKHIVAFPLQAWGTSVIYCGAKVLASLTSFNPGHARPLINLIARFVKLRPVQVTLLTTNAFFDRVKNELARSFEAEDEEAFQRIRCGFQVCH